MGLPAFQSGSASLISVEDYLRFEAEAETDTKHEYANGRVWSMAGADLYHNEINYNLNQGIGPQLRKNGCKGYMSDQRVQTKNRAGYLYPDTVAVCGKPLLAADHKPVFLTNPVFIVVVFVALYRR